MEDIRKAFVELDVYGWFFAIMALSVLSMVIGVVGLHMFTDTEHGNPYVTYPLATLFAVAIMGNMCDNSATAKEIFWGWIVVTVGFAVIGGIGYGLVTLTKFIVALF